jgi:hypothetical protein
MNAKTYSAWLLMKQWCEQNPGKPAMIDTAEGMFTITFTPRDIKKLTGIARRGRC